MECGAISNLTAGNHNRLRSTSVLIREPTICRLPQDVPHPTFVAPSNGFFALLDVEPAERMHDAYARTQMWNAKISYSISAIVPPSVCLSTDTYSIECYLSSEDSSSCENIAFVFVFIATFDFRGTS